MQKKLHRESIATENPKMEKKIGTTLPDSWGSVLYARSGKPAGFQNRKEASGTVKSMNNRGAPA